MILNEPGYMTPTVREQLKLTILVKDNESADKLRGMLGYIPPRRHPQRDMDSELPIHRRRGSEYGAAYADDDGRES